MKEKGRCSMKARVKVAALAAGVAMGIGLFVGCVGVPDAETAARRAAVKREVAEVVRLAYEAGGRELVSERIDRMVADGTITEEQAAMIRTAAQAVYERAVDRLAGGTNVTATVTGGDANGAVR